MALSFIALQGQQDVEPEFKPEGISFASAALCR